MPINSCYDKAVELLARRSHFRRQLEAKLVARDYPRDEVEATLARLEGEGLVDDAQTTREWLEARMAREPLGRVRLRAELERRGAPRDEIAAALAEVYPEDDGELAAAAAERWLRRGRRDRDALARHLGRRGFSRRAIFAALPAAEREDVDPFP